jgi:hypothetical protein
MKINIQNYETYFLFYIDNELSAEEIMEVEKFVKDHPALANELTALKQTVLAADPILFEDKALLYRYDEMEAILPLGLKQNLYREEAKVVVGFFTRSRMIGIASIAAILLLLLGYPSYFTVPINEEKGISKNAPIKSIDNKVLKSITANTIIENNSITKYKSKANFTPESKIFTSDNLPLTEETTFIPEKTKLLDIVNIEPEIRNSKIKETAILSISENMNSNLTLSNNLKEINEVDYTNIDTDDQDKTIYIANFEIDGDKFRGISRRFNAIFKRNKNDKQK